jgi:tRNA (guanine37-N1)-methyltransferase
MDVPAILSSGDHGAVARWRRDQALERTLQRRPDLLPERRMDEAAPGDDATAGRRPPRKDSGQA